MDVEENVSSVEELALSQEGVDLSTNCPTIEYHSSASLLPVLLPCGE